MAYLPEFVLLSFCFVHLGRIQLISADVASGTGYRKHEERHHFHFTDSAEPDEEQKNDRIHCGEVNNLAYEESIKFQLNKKKCSVTALGSLAEQCTATITCSKLHFHEPVHGKCSKGFLQITDSLGGGLTMCGKTKFHGPYKPSNNGTDLYIRYEKPLGKHTVCMVVCDEDRDKRVQIPARPLLNDFSRRNCKGCHCGIKLNKQPISKSGSRGRVVGGNTADPFEFPWIAAIVDKGTRKPFCGGSLINDRYILTAAHCFAGHAPVEAEEVDVLLHAHVMDFNPNSDYNPDAPAGHKGSVKEVPGLHLREKTDADEKTIRVGVSRVIVHPLWSTSSQDFDVALLRLEKRVDLEHHQVSTVCLPKEGEIRAYVNQSVVVAGWGKPHETAGASSRLLQKLTSPVIHYKTCSDLLGTRMTPRMLCAGHLEGGKDSCVGDSGGPLIYQFNDLQYRQIGVVSFGAGCAKEDSPGVYTNLQEVIQWVYHETEDAYWCTREHPPES